MVVSTLLVLLIVYATYRSGLSAGGLRAIDGELARVSALDLVALVLLFIGLVWRNLVVDLWTTMTGRKWPSRVVALYAAVAIAGFPASSVWLAQHRDVRVAMEDVLPLIAGVLLFAKLVSALVLARTSLRSGLLEPRVVLASAGLWLALVAFALVLVARFTTITALTVQVVALLVPLARLAAAPIALRSSRHG